MSIDSCAGCAAAVDTDTDDAAYYLNTEPDIFAGMCRCEYCREQWIEIDENAPDDRAAVVL